MPIIWIHRTTAPILLHPCNVLVDATTEMFRSNSGIWTWLMEQEYATPVK